MRFKEEIHVDHCFREVQSSLDLVMAEGEVAANSLKPVIRVAMICEHFNGQNVIKRQSDFKTESHNGANANQCVEQNHQSSSNQNQHSIDLNLTHLNEPCVPILLSDVM